MELKTILSKKWRSYFIVALSLLLLQFSLSVQAQAPLCSNLFTSEVAIPGTQSRSSRYTLTNPEQLRSDLLRNYQNRNEVLSKRYPKLSFVFKDPEAFISTMKERFEQQKKLTPEDPRVFNFPEAASTMHEIKEDLGLFRAELISQLQLHKNSLRNKVAHSLLNKRSSPVETINKVLRYVGKVERDIQHMIDTNTYPYRDTIYTLYYYSRIRGFFQFKDLNTYYQISKYLDMNMHGYRRLDIDAELRLYKAKDSPIVQVRSGKIATEFRLAELPFRRTFERKDTLEYVIIPSVQALGSSAFLHVLPHNLHFLGATNTPVAADGFKRPGGLFWMHDVRHEADRYMKINAYRKAQNLSKKQDEQMTLLMHQWQAEFLNMKNSIQDHNLKAAVEHYHFYTHHDVGVPMIPSMFLNHHMKGVKVYYAFLLHKKWSGQGPEYKKWVKTTRQAQDVLTKFWEERLHLETGLLQKDPVKIKDWEEWFPKDHPTKSTTSLLNNAIESQATVKIVTDNTGVEGVLSKVLYNTSGEPIFLQFSRDTQLLDRAQQILPAQGTEVHGQGYSSPIGKISSIKSNGTEITLNQLQEGQQIHIQYESGIQVFGEIKKRTFDNAGTLSVLTFSTANVHLHGRALYKPEWGSFDLMLANKIESLELGL